MFHAHEQGTLWLLKIKLSPGNGFEQAKATAKGEGFRKFLILHTRHTPAGVKNVYMSCIYSQ